MDKTGNKRSRIRMNDTESIPSALSPKQDEECRIRSDDNGDGQHTRNRLL